MSDVMRGRPLDDDALAEVLRDLATAVAWPDGGDAPTAGPDLAARVRARIVAAPPRRERTWSGPRAWRPARRALVLALAAVLVLAAVAGAVALGVPGLRLILADPSDPPPTPAASATPAPGGPGTGLRLGRSAALDEAATLVGRPIRLPTDPALGPPDDVYVDVLLAGAVSLVWATGDDLPATSEPGVGAILTAFDGTMEDELFLKVIASGTTVEEIEVDGERGYWISGDPHVFFVRDPAGRFVEDPRRWVGDALVWSDGGISYRLETALGRDAALRIATSLE